jgi:hypothetical protein
MEAVEKNASRHSPSEIVQILDLREHINAALYNPRGEWAQSLWQEREMPIGLSTGVNGVWGLNRYAIALSRRRTESWRKRSATQHELRQQLQTAREQVSNRLLFDY